MDQVRSELEAVWMKRALRLAARGAGRVEPNPMVGCVLVKNGQVIGQGWHRRFGGKHAEINALDDCRARDHDPRGCEAFVTLEPCAHHGKTPPCTDALIRSGIARVHVAMIDPFEKVAGRGIAQLRQAGIEVQLGLCESQARALNRPFIKRVQTGLPWVMLKWAQTVDGRIAAANGHSQWISNQQSRKMVHQLRARVDAIMVGVGTVLADDPALTARDVPIRRRARRVVVDPTLRMPAECRLMQTLGPDAPLTVAVRQAMLDQPNDKLRALAQRGVEFVGLTPDQQTGDCDLRPLLSHLAQTRAATNVLVEGGATLTGHLLRQGLADQVLAFVAPRLAGDATALPALRGLSITTMDQATRMTLTRTRRLGDDMLLDYRVTVD